MLSSCENDNTARVLASATTPVVEVRAFTAAAVALAVSPAVAAVVAEALVTVLVIVRSSLAVTVVAGTVVPAAVSD